MPHKGTEQILKQRYLWEWDFEEGTIQETPEQMILRVAKKIASAFLNIKKDYKQVAEYANDFYKIISEGKFIPSSPQLFNAMRGYGSDRDAYDLIYKPIDKMSKKDWDTINEFKNPKAAYGSCYAMGRIGDSIDEIYDALKEQAVVFKSAGGYGVSFSDLRSEGSLVSTTMGESCGPVEFMDLFNSNTQKIALSGKTKRGANMFSMAVSHPDIEKFISRKGTMIKDDSGQIRPKYLEHVNISVEVTDAFMDAVENDKDWNLIDPHTTEVKKTVKARELWDLIIDTAYKSADPGLLMIDNINKFNPLKGIHRIKSVNPCVTGDTLVPTNKGLIRADQLEKDMLTWNPIKNRMDKITKVFNNGVKDIYRVAATCDIGEVNTLVATAEHKLMRVRFDESEPENEILEMIPISELKPGDLVKVVFSRTDDQPYKAFTGLNTAHKTNARIFSIKHMGQDVVYDITVPDDYMWVTNGFISLDCSEYTGYDKTVCNLGSINLYSMLTINSFGHMNQAMFDFDMLTDVVRKAVIYLNLALLANDYPLEVLTQRSLEYRPIGLGFMGLASAFMRLGYEYGSEESAEFTKDFIEEFVYQTVKASNEFYHISGVKFKDYDKSDYSKGIFNFRNDKYKQEISDLLKDGITNSRLIAIAPTGSISMLAAYLTSDAASVSGGIEPVFSLNYTRKVNPNTDQEFVIDQDDIALRDTIKTMGYDDDVIRRIMDGDPKAKHIISSPRFKTAEQLDMNQHLSILNIVSSAIDMSVSKTINLPANTSKQEISDLYKLAYKMGLKGITIFREGSRQAVLKDKAKEKKKEITFDLGIDLTPNGKIKPKERPLVIQALKKTVHFKDGEDTKILNIEIGFDERNDPFEVFIRASTSTKDYSELFNSIGRLLSLSLRSGIDVEIAVKQIKKIKNWKNEYSPICQAIAVTVEELVQLGKAKTKKKQQEAIDKINKQKLVTTEKGYLVDTETREAYCPVCGAKKGEGLTFASGCINCACGWSACA